MPWTSMIMIALLLGALFYTFDMMNKVSQDVKYIKLTVDKISQEIYNKKT